MNCYRPGEGLIPASFGNRTDDRKAESLEADFGEKAIGRVAPIDAPFWWLYLLRVYTKSSGDTELARAPEFQKGNRLILGQVLPPRFDMFPTLLVPDGLFMIDRRLGVHGHPIDIQSLFFAGLGSAIELLSQEDEENHSSIDAAEQRARQLLFHIRNYYWIDLKHLNPINRYPMEDYGKESLNRFNINPTSIPAWVVEWLTEKGGYLAGNFGPGRLDFRFFSGGNLLALLISLADWAAADMLIMRPPHKEPVATLASFPTVAHRRFERVLATGGRFRRLTVYQHAVLSRIEHAFRPLLADAGAVDSVDETVEGLTVYQSPGGLFACRRGTDDRRRCVS